MKQLTLVLALASAPSFAEGITPEDRTWLLDQLEKSRTEFVSSIKNVSDAQWKYKPAPDRWSVAEVSEHITVTEPMLFGMITNKVLKSAPTPESRGNREGDMKLLNMMTDRSKKATAPEMLRPAERFKSKEEVIQAFTKERAKVIEFVKTTDADLRNYSAKSATGPTDGYQWFLYLSGHVQRHTAQIKEVQADNGYPSQ